MVEPVLLDNLPEISAKEIPSFERIQLEEGQINFSSEALEQLSDPEGFKSALITQEPWNHPEKGINIKHHDIKRRIQKYIINNIGLVLKQTHQSGYEVSQARGAFKKQATLTNTPSAQAALVSNAIHRYKQIYGGDISFEQLLGFYIDSGTTEKYMLYQFYEEMTVEGKLLKESEEGNKILQLAEEEVKEIDKKLLAVGVDRGESQNYLIIPDTSSERGWKIMFIDTEFLRLTPEARPMQKGEGLTSITEKKAA